MASASNQSISSFQCPLSINFDPKNFTNLPAFAVPTWISLAVINAVACPPTVIINLLVIWTVLENEQLRSDCYNLMVAVLSPGDLLMGLVGQPILVALLICITVQCSSLCEFVMALMIPTLLCIWTVFTMTVISLERYLFIEHPLYHVASVTSKKLMIVTAVGWLVMGTAVLTSRFLTNNSFWARQLPAILIFGPSFIIILFCITKIHLTARRQMKAIAAQQQSVTQQNKIKDYKRTFTLGLIVLASVLCFCPVLILKIVGVAKGDGGDHLKYISQGLYLTVMYLQSLINPIIYSLRLSDIRSGVARKLRFNCQ